MTPKEVDDYYLRLIASTAHEAIVNGYTREQIADLDRLIRQSWKSDRRAARLRSLDELATYLRSEGQPKIASLVESFKETNEPI